MSLPVWLLSLITACSNNIQMDSNSVTCIIFAWLSKCQLLSNCSTPFVKARRWYTISIVIAVEYISSGLNSDMKTIIWKMEVFTSVYFLSFLFCLAWSEIHVGVTWGNSSANQSHQPKSASYDGGRCQASFCHLHFGASWKPVSISEM